MLTVGSATVLFTMSETVTTLMLAVRIVVLVHVTTPRWHAFGPTGIVIIDAGTIVRSSSFAALVLLPRPFLFPFFLSLSLRKELFGCTPCAGAFDLLGGDVILTTADFHPRPIAGLARVTHASTIPAS